MRLMTQKITFGRYQLAVNLGRKLGRPNKPISQRVTEFILNLQKIAQDKRLHGQPTSRVFRLVFENKRIKNILGVNLTVMVLFSGIASSPITALRQEPYEEIVTLAPTTLALITEKSVRPPFEAVKITQRFRSGHAGLDIKGEIGTPVYPIMDGTIEAVYFGRFSYGNHILVDHGSNFKSLYAHLSKILVEAGDKVDKNTEIGQVGSTGWSTGPHLHLEVWENSHPFDPLTILK